jgi:hypothetical protein
VGHRQLIGIITSGLIGFSWLPLALAGPEQSDAVDKVALETWRTAVQHNIAPPEGCGKITYPSYVWEKVECKTGAPRAHSVPRRPRQGGPDNVGTGPDYTAQSTGLTTQAVGSFPTATGIITEESVGDDGGILGSNEYSLQINTNNTGTTSACAGHTGCTVWQQFIYGTDYFTPGEGAVYIQYWLVNWGTSANCPIGWNTYGSDCWVNGENTASPPDVPATSLGSLTLTATATAGGNDTAVLTNGTTAYSVTEPDSMLDISSVWQDTEFNVFGDSGGSQAQFNYGTTLGVQLVLTDGSTAAPACVFGDGTTGETNNLNLGSSCTTTSGSSPAIQFTESLLPTMTEGKYCAQILPPTPAVLCVTGYGTWYGLPVNVVVGSLSPNTLSGSYAVEGFYDLST